MKRKMTQKSIKIYDVDGAKNDAAQNDYNKTKNDLDDDSFNSDSK